MSKRITVVLDDAAAALLPRLAGHPRNRGAYLSNLIRAAGAGAAPLAPATGGAPDPAELETLRVQMRGIISELQTINARLVTLETRDE